MAKQKRRPLGGWSRKNPAMAFTIIMLALIYFFLSVVLHAFG